MPAQNLRLEARKRSDRNRRTAAVNRQVGDPYADPAHDHSFVDAPGAHADDRRYLGDDLRSRPGERPPVRGPLGKIGSNVSVPTPGLTADLLAESVSNVLVRRLWLEGYGVSSPDELIPPHDSEAERRIIAATYWGYAKPIILRAINASHFFDPQCARLWSAAQATQREMPHPGPPGERSAIAMLYSEVPQCMGPLSDWIEAAVRHARAMGGVGSVAAVLVELLDTYRFADEPQLLRYADTLIELSERRNMLKLLRRAVLRLATGTTTARAVRERVVRRLGGVLP